MRLLPANSHIICQIGIASELDYNFDFDRNRSTIADLSCLIGPVCQKKIVSGLGNYVEKRV